MKILYIGSSGILSQLPLQRIAASDHELVAVGVDAVLPGERGLIAIHNETVESFARQRGLAVIDLTQSAHVCARQVGTIGPDIIISSCFPRRIADEVLSAARLGAYNLHPSLLPAYRGPMPVFWQLRDDLEELGVTLHRMSGILDAGDIVAQRTVAIDNELEYENIVERLAAAGTDLVLQMLETAQQGRPPATPQREEAASCQTFPDEDAFMLPASWGARRMFRFIRRTRALGHAFRYETSGIVLSVDNAFSWSHATADRPEIHAHSATLPCIDGSVQVELAGGQKEKP